MKQVLVFRHVPHEGPGTLEPFLKSRNVGIEYCDLFNQSKIPKESQPYDLIISMGGPMNADETDRYPFLGSERLFLKQAIQKNQPVIGICLGSQLIARALDAKVYSGPQKEIGWFPLSLTEAGAKDPVFGQFASKNPVVFHWHGDTFDLPKGAVHLASSALYRHQAFRFNENVYALQFHIEITPQMIELWIEENKEELQGLKQGPSGETLLRDTEKYMSSLDRNTDKLYPALYSKLIGLES